MMLRSLLFTVIALLVVFATGCSDTSTGPSSGGAFTFPLVQGNLWRYQSQYLDVSVVGARDAVLDTVDVDYWLEVARVETLLDTLVCFRLVENATVDSLEWATGATYYGNLEEGLYTYAYTPGGVGFGIGVSPKRPGGSQLLFRGHPLSDVRRVLSRVGGGLLVPARDDTLIFEDPPVRSLAYPMFEGRQWTYREPGSPWAIDKRVTGRAPVDVPAGTFSCYAVKWLIDMWDADGQWDDDIDWTDYFSGKGLIKRTLTFRDCVIVDIEGQVIDTLDIWEVTRLSDLDLE